jgi:DNA-binding winged helix-turn-helix (wHTH) protein
VTDLVASERAISFGPFRLVPTQRLLLEDDNPVRVGSRALDILTALVERPGELVGKHELMARVWRGTFVEEGNLKFQVGALRRALGDGRGGRRYIATSAGQGYRFVAPVSVAQAPAAAALPAAPTRQNHNLPQQLTRLIGRADAASRIVARLQRHRLLSIVGPGGIGKTSVALAAAEALVNAYEHGVWFVDLAPLADARLVPSALATVLGFDIRSDDPVPDPHPQPLRPELIELQLAPQQQRQPARASLPRPAQAQFRQLDADGRGVRHRHAMNPGRGE